MVLSFLNKNYRGCKKINDNTKGHIDLMRNYSQKTGNKSTINVKTQQNKSQKSRGASVSNGKGSLCRNSALPAIRQQR